METENERVSVTDEEDHSHDDNGEMVQESGFCCGTVCVQISNLGNGMSDGVSAVEGRCFRSRGHCLCGGTIVGAGDDHENRSHPFVAIRSQNDAVSTYLWMFSMADYCEVLTSWRGGLVHPVGFCLPFHDH